MNNRDIGFRLRRANIGQDTRCHLLLLPNELKEKIYKRLFVIKHAPLALHHSSNKDVAIALHSRRRVREHRDTFLDFFNLSFSCQEFYAAVLGAKLIWKWNTFIVYSTLPFPYAKLNVWGSAISSIHWVLGPKTCPNKVNISATLKRLLEFRNLKALILEFSFKTDARMHSFDLNTKGIRFKPATLNLILQQVTKHLERLPPFEKFELRLTTLNLCMSYLLDWSSNHRIYDDGWMERLSWRGSRDVDQWNDSAYKATDFGIIGKAMDDDAEYRALETKLRTLLADKQRERMTMRRSSRIAERLRSSVIDRQ